MRGGVVVVGRVTGTHMIEDINVPVHHMVPVAITPEQAYRSKDLWRAIQQNRVFKLDCTPFKPEDAPQVQNDARVTKLEQENRELRQRVLDTEAQKVALEAQLEGLRERLDSVLDALGRIEKAGPVVVNGVAVAAAAVTEAVGGETPAFIPDQITPENAEAQITADEGTTAGTKVADATSKLRELRKQQAGDEDLDFG